MKDQMDYKVYRSNLVLKHEELQVHPIKLNSAVSVLKFAEDALHIDEYPEEVSFVICLNANKRAINVFELSKGLGGSTFIGIKELMRRVLLANADSFVIIHNHPTCEANPSPQDISITEAVLKASKLMDIDFVDHIIIGHESYISIRNLMKGAGQSWQ